MPMQVYKEPVETGAERLENAIRDYLGANKQVLWLVSGGSNVAIAAQIAKNLGKEAEGFVKAALVDERYGEVGHADSNYRKLINAGFENSGILLTPVLQPGLPFRETADRYEQTLAHLIDEADVVIAQLGIGADGHTAGVLPHSPAVDSPKLVAAYEGPDFIRITVTLQGLQKAGEAYVFCYGADKAVTLRRLFAGALPLTDQPAQILKHIRSVYLYNDQVEGDSA